MGAQTHRKIYGHHCYVDSIWSVVETPELSCGLCLGLEADDMPMEEVNRELGVASRRTILRHMVYSEYDKTLKVHFVVCWHEYHKRGLECCFDAPYSLNKTWEPMSLKEFVVWEREMDRQARDGDNLPHEFGTYRNLQEILRHETPR